MVFGQSVCICAKVVVFEQIGSILAKLLLVGHKAFRWSKMVVFG